MTESRPNPIHMAAALRDLGECWDELDEALTRSTPNRNHSSPDGRPPLDVDVLDAKRAIDSLAFTYAAMLMEDTDWEPPRGADTPALLDGLARRIGHFTHHEDARVAYEFAQDVERVTDETLPIARPNGLGRIPIGPCPEADCGGTMRITIDRDKAEMTTLRQAWDKALKCTANRGHVWLLGTYAREVLDMTYDEVQERVDAYFDRAA